MAPQLKHFFSPALVRRLAADITRVHRPFPADAFVRQATRGLAALELSMAAQHALTRRRTCWWTWPCTS